MSTPSRLRILVLALNYAPEPSGSAPYTAGLASALHARGHDVEVVTTHPHYPTWRVFSGYDRRRRRDRVDGVAVRRLRCYIPAQPRALHRLVYELSFGARLLVTPLPSADVVLLASPALFSTALATLRLRLTHRRTPRVVWVQDLYAVGVAETDITNSRLAPAVARVEGAVIGKAERAITIHPNMKATLAGQGVPEQRISVIRNWTHLPPHHPAERDDVRRRLGWPLEKTVALHSGNMGFKQGLEVVVDAAQSAREQGLPLHFVLMGDGNQRRDLEERAGSEPAVQFLDPLPGAEYQDAMTAADVLLLVDRAGVGSMAVPSKLTSYFTTGNPVLGSTDPQGNAGVEITTAGAGVLARPGDPDDLIRQVIWLSEHRDEALGMGARGQDFCRRVLSMDNAVDEIEAVLMDAAAQVRAEPDGRELGRRPRAFRRRTKGVTH